MAGGGAGEPVGLVGEAVGGRWGELAVGGEGGFEGDEGLAVLDEVGEGVVEVLGLLLEGSDGDFYACGAEFGDALAADEGVWVGGGDDAAGDAGGDEGVGAGAGAAVVGAGLEGYVGCGADGGDAACGGLFEGCDFGVVAVVVEVGAFGDDLTVVDEDAAYLGVGRRVADGVVGEAKGLLHEAFVLFDLGHFVPSLVAFRGYPPGGILGAKFIVCNGLAGVWRRQNMCIYWGYG